MPSSSFVDLATARLGPSRCQRIARVSPPPAVGRSVFVEALRSTIRMLTGGR